MVKTRFRRWRERRSPVVSAMSLKEWAEPRARTLRLPATRACTCATVSGTWNRAAPNVWLPAQLRRGSAICVTTVRSVGHSWKGASRVCAEYPAPDGVISGEADEGERGLPSVDWYGAQGATQWQQSR